MKGSEKLTFAALSALFLAVIAALPAYTLLFSTETIFLKPSGKAEWIRRGGPVSLGVKFLKDGPSRVTFKKTFDSGGAYSGASVSVRALRGVKVYLDGRELKGSEDAWTEPLEVALDGLGEGAHELAIEVVNGSGPALLLAYSDALAIHTGADWEAGTDEGWAPAVPADSYDYAEISREFPRADRALFYWLPVLVPLFLSVFLLTVYHDKKPGSFGSKLAPSAGALRFMIMGALAALYANNFWKLPPATGYDRQAHFEYIKYVAENLSIPLATEGWQMFQSPLYYVLSAPVYLYASALPFETALRALRLVPEICAVLTVEAVYRAMLQAFPARKDLQAVGVVIGGLIPMNIYMSQTFGNEPVSTLFSSAAIAAGLWVLRAPSGGLPVRRLLVSGLFLGLALLSKVTAVLLTPVLAAVLVYRFARKGEPSGLSRAAASVFLVFGAAFAVSGWYYVRNWIYMGSPFVGGWDTSRGMEWWQHPGYRTLRQLYGFGESLFYPVYSAVNGFWDSIYSTMWMDGFLSSFVNPASAPAWNFGLMLSSAWLALVPALGIIAGIFVSLLKGREALDSGAVFGAFCVAIYFGALLDLYLKVPIYSTAKASYTAGITPFYALLGAIGLGCLIRGTFSRAAAYGALACWAVFSYGAYFIV